MENKKKARKPKGFWNDVENIKKYAKKYDGKYDFQKNCNGAYKVAHKLGILDELFDHKPNPKGYWTEEKIRELAKDCVSKNDFRQKHGGGYKKAIDLGLMDEIFGTGIYKPKNKKFPKTQKPNGYWTEDKVREEAIGCNNKTDFMNKNESAYKKAYELNIINDLFCNVKRPDGYWNDETTRLHASKCKTKMEFKKDFYAGYHKALTLGILDELFDNVFRKDGFWNDIEILKHFANECDSRSQFGKRFSTAYKKANEIDILDELFPDTNNSNLYKQRPHIVYRYILENGTETPLIYVGITQDETRRKTAHLNKNSYYSAVSEKISENYELKSYDILHSDITFKEADDLETKLIGEYMNDKNYICINKDTKGNYKL